MYFELKHHILLLIHSSPGDGMYGVRLGSTSNRWGAHILMPKLVASDDLTTTSKTFHDL